VTDSSSLHVLLVLNTAGGTLQKVTIKPLCCVLRCVDKPWKPDPPSYTVDNPYGVTVSYEPPANIDASRVVKYRVKYRKLELGEWQAVPETINMSRIITNLDGDSTYVIRVAAKYDGEQLGPESESARLTTKEPIVPGMCCAPALEPLKLYSSSLCNFLHIFGHWQKLYIFETS